MKKILDISAKIIGGYIAATGTKRKIKRYWGTESVDGIDVFKEKKYIYPRALLDGDESTVKLLKLMDSYDDIASSKMEGIDNAWLYLNYNKLAGSTEAYFTKDWIAGMIEGCMSIGIEYTFYVNFTSTSYDGYWNKPKPDVFAGMTDSEILAYVFAHYQELYTTHNFQGRADSVVTMDELSKFLPFNDEPNDFTIVPKKVSKSIQLKKYDATEIGSSYNYVETTYSVEYTATRLSAIDKDTTLVGKIYDAANEAERQQIIRDSQNNYSDSDDIYTPDPPPPPTDGMYYSGRLRADYYDSLTAKDALKLFGMLLDQDFQKKRTKWWKQVLVIVIIVVVVVISGPAGGWAATGAMTGAEVAAAIAFSATMVALTMTAVALYGSKNGEYGAAELAGKYGQISGKVAMIAGIYAILQGAYNAVASKYAAQQAQQSVATAIVEAVKEMSMKAWNQALSFVSNLYQMKAKNEIDDIASEMEEVKQKSEEIRQEQTLANDEDYVASLAMLTVMDRDHEQLAKLNEKYYNMTDGRFDATRFNIMKAGEFKGIGVFSVSYT